MITIIFLFVTSCRAGKNLPEPGEAPNIRQIDDHSQILPLLARRGMHGLQILHVDAHHDLWPSPSEAEVEKASHHLSRKEFDALEQAGRYFAPRQSRLYGINNFLVMAHRLRLVSSVYWAYPVLGLPGPETLRQIQAEILRSAPAGLKPEIENLAVVPPYLRGTISGVPLTIGSLASFPDPASEFVLDVDLDFFSALYKNPVKNSFLNLLSGFAEFFRKRKLEPAVTVISSSNHGYYLPIEMRFLGPWLLRLLRDPSLLDGPPPRAWSLKEEALSLEFFGQHRKAITLYETILRDSPVDPDAWFSKGMNLIAAGETDPGIRSLEKSARLDPAYLYGFVEASSFLQDNGNVEGAMAVLRAGEAVSPGFPPLLDELGNIYHNARKYEKAVHYYRKVIQENVDTPSTHMFLGDSYRLLGRIPEAEGAYRTAIRIHAEDPDSPLPAACWLYLAEALETQGKTGEAILRYREYSILSQNTDPAESARIQEHILRLESLPALHGPNPPDR